MRKAMEKGCKRIAVYITLLALMIQPITSVLANPKMDATGSGLSVVEINTPSEGNIFYNPFDKFEVNQQGINFHHSQTLMNTTLAGYIMGNQSLINGLVRLILAEVIGSQGNGSAIALEPGVIKGKLKYVSTGNGEGKVVEVSGKAGTLSNLETRQWYLQQEAKIPELINQDLSLEEQARQAFALRNQFRTQARALMADRELAASLSRTDKNLTWEEIVKKYTDKGFRGDDLYREIINAAQRSRKSVNKSLGIE